MEQVTQLTARVQQLQAAQAASDAGHEATAALLGRGILTLLTRSGATEAEAWAAMYTPFARPAPSAEPAELATPAADSPTASAPAANPLPPMGPQLVAAPAGPATAAMTYPPAPEAAGAGRRAAQK